MEVARHTVVVLELVEFTDGMYHWQSGIQSCCKRTRLRCACMLARCTMSLECTGQRKLYAVLCASVAAPRVDSRFSRQ